MSLDSQATLPQRLRVATHELHARAERSGVMADLLARRISREAYVSLLTNLHAIYAAMEDALDATNRPGHSAALARSTALASDLRAFGADPNAALAPVTRDYVARLRSLRGPQAHRLWAHVYVRYLGDLHGGQVLSRLVRDLFPVVVDGTRFYDFGADNDVLALRESLRSDLRLANLDASQVDEVVAEAVWAFEAHCGLFEQIREGAPMVASERSGVLSRKLLPHDEP